MEEEEEEEEGHVIDDATESQNTGKCLQNGVPDAPAGVSADPRGDPRLHHRLRPHDGCSGKKRRLPAAVVARRVRLLRSEGGRVPACWFGAFLGRSVPL